MEWKGHCTKIFVFMLIVKIEQLFNHYNMLIILKLHRSLNKSLPLRIISRIVVITSLLIIVYFSSKENIVTFAKQSELLPGKGVIVECSTEYTKEVVKYEGCIPRDCKRFVTDQVVSEREAEELLKLAQKGLKHGGSYGGASILDLHSGALSKGQHFVNIYKLKEMKHLFTQNDFNVFRVC